MCSKLIGVATKLLPIFYSDISRVEMNNLPIGINGTRTGTILFQGKRKEKFDIGEEKKYEDCVLIVKTFLGDKLRKPFSLRKILFVNEQIVQKCFQIIQLGLFYKTTLDSYVDP